MDGLGGERQGDGPDRHLIELLLCVVWFEI
jgi:hypothetical protein